MTAKRQANFELLRIVAMLMIIALHYLVKGGVAVPYSESREAVNYAAWLLEAFCIAAVDCYVLLSGYFLVESAWRPGRIVSLLGQVLFYSVLIPLIMIGVGILSWADLGLYDWIGFFLPVGTEHYWFATAYVFFYLFAPILAAGMKKMEKKTLQLLIALLLLFFCAEKTFLPVPFVTDRYGYDYGWFLCLFVVAAYLRLYGCAFFEKGKRALWIYAGMSIAIFGVSAIVSLFGGQIEALGFYADMPYTYNHLLCLCGALGLFLAFGKLQIKEGRAARIIRRLSPYTFGVYLLHEHLLVRYEWMNWLHVDKVRGTWGFLPHMAGSILLVYVVGTLVDFVREYLLQKATAFCRKK